MAQALVSVVEIANCIGILMRLLLLLVRLRIARLGFLKLLELSHQLSSVHELIPKEGIAAGGS